MKGNYRRSRETKQASHVEGAKFFPRVSARSAKGRVGKSRGAREERRKKAKNLKQKRGEQPNTVKQFLLSQEPDEEGQNTRRETTSSRGEGGGGGARPKTRGNNCPYQERALAKEE